MLPRRQHWLILRVQADDLVFGAGFFEPALDRSISDKCGAGRWAVCSHAVMLMIKSSILERKTAALQSCSSYSVHFLNSKTTVHQNTMKLIIILFGKSHFRLRWLPSSKAQGAAVIACVGVCVCVCVRVRDWALCCFALAAPGLG